MADFALTVVIRTSVILTLVVRHVLVYYCDQILLFSKILKLQLARSPLQMKPISQILNVEVDCLVSHSGRARNRVAVSTFHLLGSVLPDDLPLVIVSKQEI